MVDSTFIEGAPDRIDEGVFGALLHIPRARPRAPRCCANDKLALAVLRDLDVHDSRGNKNAARA